MRNYWWNGLRIEFLDVVTLRVIVKGLISQSGVSIIEGDKGYDRTFEGGELELFI